MGGYIQCLECGRIKHFEGWLPAPVNEQEKEILKRYRRIERLCPKCEDAQNTVGDIPVLPK